MKIEDENHRTEYSIFQVLIANAIHHALADNRFAGNQAAMPAYLASLSPTMTQQVINL